MLCFHWIKKDFCIRTQFTHIGLFISIIPYVLNMTAYTYRKKAADICFVSPEYFLIFIYLLKSPHSWNSKLNIIVQLPVESTAFTQVKNIIFYSWVAICLLALVHVFNFCKSISRSVQNKNSTLYMIHRENCTFDCNLGSESHWR